jgi:hypothetical protein
MVVKIGSVLLALRMNSIKHRRSIKTQNMCIYAGLIESQNDAKIDLQLSEAI